MTHGQQWLRTMGSFLIFWLIGEKGLNCWHHASSDLVDSQMTRLLKFSEVNESPQDYCQLLYMNLSSCVFVNCVLLNWPWDPGVQVVRFMMLQVVKIIHPKNYWHNAIIGSSVLYLHHSRELPTQVGTKWTLKYIQYLFGEAVKLWML